MFDRAESSALAKVVVSSNARVPIIIPPFATETVSASRWLGKALQPRFERAITVDDGFASRISRTAFLSVIRTSARIFRIAVGSLVIALGVWLYSQPLGPLAWVFAALSLPIVPLVYALAYRISQIPVRRMIRSRFPAGSTYTLELFDDGLKVTTGMATSELSYDLYSSLRVDPYFVSLGFTAGGPPTMLPRELFTDESLAWLSKSLSARRRPSPRAA